MTHDMGPPALPEEFAARLRRLLPADGLARWQAAFAAPPVTAFRINRLRGGEADAIAELEGAGLTPRRLEWPAEAWVVPPDQRRALTQSDAVAAGRACIHNPSSMVPAALLAPQPGEEVLDLAAAPGGKTAMLAELMGNRGRIAAVESVRGRFFRLRVYLERCGVTIAETYLADGAGVGRKVPERFDRVLLDAPCSSEGRFAAAEPASYRYWSVRKIREMARKQRRLARSAVQALKPGGVMVYCTCTLAPEENEAIVDDLLAGCQGALQVEAVALPPGVASPGLSAWDGRPYAPALGGCARILPDPWREGFFIARLRKVASLPAADRVE